MMDQQINGLNFLLDNQGLMLNVEPTQSLLSPNVI